jgi:ABC-type multidrug transport system ATPase subunit
MIITSNLSKKYNGVSVLHIENLEIPKGQSFGLVGNNGAGKTTYFSLLLDLIQPTTLKTITCWFMKVKIGNHLPRLLLMKVF